MTRVFPRLLSVRPVRDFLLEITFADGVRAQMDFTQKIAGRGRMFTPLEDVAFFQQVKVDPEAGTLIWPNGVDLDPDVLYCEATGTPLPTESPTAG